MNGAARNLFRRQLSAGEMIIERHLLRSDVEPMASRHHREALDAAWYPNGLDVLGPRINERVVDQDARSSASLTTDAGFPVRVCSSTPMARSASRTHFFLSKRAAMVALAARPRSESCRPPSAWTTACAKEDVSVKGMRTPLRRSSITSRTGPVSEAMISHSVAMASRSDHERTKG